MSYCEDGKPTRLVIFSNEDLRVVRVTPDLSQAEYVVEEADHDAMGVERWSAIEEVGERLNELLCALGAVYDAAHVGRPVLKPGRPKGSM